MMKILIGQYWEFAISKMGCIGKYLKTKLGNLESSFKKIYLNRKDTKYIENLFKFISDITLKMLGDDDLPPTVV